MVLKPAEIGTLVALVDQERLVEAEQRARALLALRPDAGMLWKILGVALMRQGKDAVPALRRAAELLPQDAEAHGNLGAALHDLEQWSCALVSLRRAILLHPHDVGALLHAANALKALGGAREAVPLYRRALNLDPRLLEAHNNLGNALLELGRFDEAVSCYRSALQIEPDDANVHCNLGNAQRQLGLLEEALDSSRRAVGLDPSSSVAHNGLGLVLADLERREEAAASYRQALQLNPGYVDALNNLGNTLRDLGLRRESVALYGRAIDIGPERADSHCNLGNALMELRQIDAAAECFRRALALQPDAALAHLGLGVALRQQRRSAAAEASCLAALAIDPACIDALALLGELRADRGRFAEAEELFQRALAIDPEFPTALCSIAAHRKMTAADDAWRRRADALLAKRLPLGREISLRHALGKYLDDIRQYYAAFEQYRQANELTKRYGSRYDAEKLTGRVDTIIARFNADFLGSPRPGASTSELPVFIIGMPRSGTSLTEQILASHADVFGAGEVTFWDSAFGAFQQAGRDGASLMADIARDYLARLTALSSAASVGAAQSSLAQSGAAQSSVVRSGAAPLNGALRVIDKMPANFMYAGLIHAAFPKARIIHMQRHPLDTCLSIYFQNFFNMGPYANDLDNLAHYYGEYVRLMNHWRAVLPATVLLEVPYEGLIDDQEGWTRRMLEFIGLPWDPKCLDFHRTDRVVITASKWQVRQKIHASSVGRWRHYERFLGPLRPLLELGSRAQSAH